MWFDRYATSCFVFCFRHNRQRSRSTYQHTKQPSSQPTKAQPVTAIKVHSKREWKTHKTPSEWLTLAREHITHTQTVINENSIQCHYNLYPRYFNAFAFVLLSESDREIERRPNCQSKLDFSHSIVERAKERARARIRDSDEQKKTQEKHEIFKNHILLQILLP